MKLHFIIGGEGSEKTAMLYQLVLNGEQAGEQNYLIVPEQGNLTAERELCESMPGKCMLYTEITSFRRLRYLLCSELGDRISGTVSDVGKSMMLSMLLKRNRDGLVLYRGKEKKQGFVSELRSVLSEMGQFAVTGEELLDAGSRITGDPILTRKLTDVSRVYGIFEQFLRDRGNITEEQVYSEMVPLVLESRKLYGKKLFLDGFTGFTPCELKLLSACFKTFAEVYVTVTLDPAEYGHDNGNDLFSMSRKMLRELTKLCEEAEGEVCAPIFVKAPQSSDLSHVTGSIFRRRLPVRLGLTDPDAIRIISCADRKEEVRSVLTGIRRLVVEEGMRYGDIGILCGDVEGYRDSLENAFRKAGVPCYIDYKADVKANPVIDFARSAVDVVRTDYSREAVLRFLKNPLSGFSAQEAGETENYLLATGLSGYSVYERELTERRYKTRHRIYREVIGNVMGRLAASLSGLRNAFTGKKNVTEVLTELYRLTELYKISDQAEALAAAAEQQAEENAASSGNGDTALLRRAKEYRQVFRAFVGILDEMALVLGDEVMDADEFADSLDAGIAELKLGVLPPKQDSVTVGDVKRSRFTGVRVLYFIGINEGVVPGIHHASGIFTETERKKLKDAGIEMAELMDDALFTEEFYLYLALLKAKERLILTYRRTDDDGSEMHSSSLIFRIAGCFTDLTETLYEEESFTDRIAFDSGEEFVLKHLSRDRKQLDSDNKRLAEALLTLQRKMLAEKLCEGRNRESREAEISPESAALLYGDTIVGSVTKLEKFAKCPFSQFANYGLGLEERPVYGLSSLDIGNIFHEVLKSFLSGLNEGAKENAEKNGISLYSAIREAYTELTPESIRERVKTLCDKTAEASPELFIDNARFRFQLSLIGEDLSNTIWYLRLHVLSGNFVPYAFEKKFKIKGDGYYFEGKIDRYDISETDRGRKLKILDYKSSNKTFSMADCYEGTSLQLPIYLSAASREEHAEPAGAAYMEVADPFVDKCEDFEKQLTSRKKEMRPSGFYLEGALSELDQELSGGAGGLKPGMESLVINVTTKKNGEPDEKTRKHLFSDEGIKTICEYADGLVKVNSAEILRGNVKVRPYGDSCDFCPYGAVCGINNGSGTARTSEFNGNTPVDEILKAMRDKTEEWKQSLIAEKDSGKIYTGTEE